MDFSESVGKLSQKHSHTVLKERVQAFAHSIGMDQWDEHLAAPPTYLTILRDTEFELFDELKIPLSRVLHAEQEYEYARPIRVGDRFEYVTRLASASSKHGKSGSLHFLEFETELETSGQEVGKIRTLVVVRGGET